MKTVAVIQARMGSSRLPGKVLMDLAGQGVLERVVRRTQRIKSINEVVVATSVAPDDDAIVAACEKIDVLVLRGSELDVLDRFMLVARARGAEACVRITSDCPLIDPDVSEHIIGRFRESYSPVDYASNKIPHSYPRGLDTEVFTVSALERAWRLASQPYERTHVTVYMYEHPDEFKLLSVTSVVDRSDWRWTVDTPEDLEFVRQIYQRLGDDHFTWEDVVFLLEREPSLCEINRHIKQKHVLDG